MKTTLAILFLSVASCFAEEVKPHELKFERTYSGSPITLYSDALRTIGAGIKNGSANFYVGQTFEKEGQCIASFSPSTNINTFAKESKVKTADKCPNCGGAVWLILGKCYVTDPVTYPVHCGSCEWVGTIH